MMPLGRPIVLAGMPAAGKSAVGRALARRIGGTHRDTDQIIEDLDGRRVTQIFADDGETAFRSLESRVLSEALSATVVSLGGGVPTQERNRDLLSERAWVVWLTVSASTARPRLAGDTSRPLLAEGFDTWQQLLDEREELYRQISDAVVSVDGKTVGRIVSEIVDAARAAGVLERVD